QAPVISVRTALGLCLQRLFIYAVPNPNAKAVIAISLSGAILGAAIRNNAIRAPIGLMGPPLTRDGEGDQRPMLVSAALRIEDNVFWCELTAIVLSGLASHTMTTSITGNEVVGPR